jgi:hypothetical protein
MMQGSLPKGGILGYLHHQHAGTTIHEIALTTDKAPAQGVWHTSYIIFDYSLASITLVEGACRCRPSGLSLVRATTGQRAGTHHGIPMDWEVYRLEHGATQTPECHGYLWGGVLF